MPIIDRVFPAVLVSLAFSACAASNSQILIEGEVENEPKYFVVQNCKEGKRVVNKKSNDKVSECINLKPSSLNLLLSWLNYHYNLEVTCSGAACGNLDLYTSKSTFELFVVEEGDERLVIRTHVGKGIYGYDEFIVQSKFDELSYEEGKPREMYKLKDGLYEKYHYGIEISPQD